MKRSNLKVLPNEFLAQVGFFNEKLKKNIVIPIVVRLFLTADVEVVYLQGEVDYMSHI